MLTELLQHMQLPSKRTAVTVSRNFLISVRMHFVHIYILNGLCQQRLPSVFQISKLALHIKNVQYCSGNTVLASVWLG